MVQTVKEEAFLLDCSSRYMEQISRFETSVNNYQSTLHNIPEERKCFY